MTKIQRIRRAHLLSGVGICAVALAVAGAPAAAQEQGPGTDENQRKLDTVVVTVNRVEQNVQDVPASVNVMDSQAIEDLQIDDVNDVLTYTPGAFAQPGSPDQSNIAIRGISSDLYGASGDAAVVTMIDNAVISRSWMRSGAAFDLERVEVARGPQGTAFGRNATGGVVHFVSRRPQQDNEGSLSVEAGNYNSFRSTVTLNRAVSETVSARIAAYVSRRDGYFEDEETGQGLDNTSTYALRGQLLYTPSETLEVLLRGSYAVDHLDNPNPSALTDPTIPVNYLNVAFPTALSTDPRVVGSSDGLFFDRTLWDIGAEVRKDIGLLTLTSLTNYRDGRIDTVRDLWGTSQDILLQESYEDAQVFQQELRLDNSASSAPLQWVAGLFYLHEDTERFEQKDILINTPRVTYQDFLQQNKTNSFGIFLNTQFDLTPSTHLGAGGRYTMDEKDYKVPFHTCSDVPNKNGDPALAGLGGSICGSFIDNFPTVSIVSGSGSADWDDFSYRVSLTQDLTDGINAYISYATGYKGGGFGNEPSDSTAVSFEAYDPETVDAVEVGIKSSLLNDSLRLDLAAYQNDYKEIQAETIAPSGSNIVFNAGGATIMGIEGEFDWRVTDNLTLYGNGGYTDAVYDAPGLVSPTGDILSTGRFRNIPLWTAYLSAAYTQPLQSGAELRYFLDWRLRADRASDIGPRGQPEITTPGDSVFGARITWMNSDGDLRLSLWGRNLTDEDDFRNVGNGMVLDLTYTVSGQVQGTRTAGAPRTFGVSLDYDF